MESSHRNQMFEQMAQGIWQVSALGQTTYVNSRMAAMVGYSTAEFLPLSPVSFLAEKDHGRIGAWIAARRIGSRDDYECQIAHKSGAWVSVLVEATPMLGDDGQFDGTIALVTDITDRRRIEDALQISEERCRLSLEAANQGLWDWDIESNSSYFSPGYYGDLGYEAGAVDGSPEAWAALIHPDDLARSQQVSSDCVEGRCESFAVEYRIKAKNGAWRWILGHGKCLGRDAHGRALRVLGTSVDITERKQMEEELRISKALLTGLTETITDGLFVKDLEGRCLFVNPAMLKLMGRTREEVLGHTVLDILEDPAVASTLLQSEARIMASGMAEEVEEIVPSPSGEHVLQTVKAPLRDDQGVVIGIVGCARDVAERKLAEAELRRLAAALKEADRLREIFTDVLRHDMVNPAATIQNAADVLLTRESDAMKVEGLRGIRQAASNLIEMTDLASTLASLSNGESLVLSAADPTETLHAVVRDFTHRLSEKGITLTDRSGPGFSASFHPLLKQAFANLISNAIKYSRIGTGIDVCVADQGETWVISVTDQGAGVPDAHKETIFHRFERLKRDGVKGTGLGLAITYQIVSLHQGRTWVEDNPSGGSIFFVSLPKSPRA